jgi:hypothetical protein
MGGEGKTQNPEFRIQQGIQQGIQNSCLTADVRRFAQIGWLMSQGMDSPEGA